MTPSLKRVAAGMLGALCLLRPALAQADGSSADLRPVVLKAQAATLSFEQYTAVESVPANAPASKQPGTRGGAMVRAIASDGDQWFSIESSAGRNCFVRYSSYLNLVEGQGLRRVCNTVAGYDGYRGLTHDGHFFYTLYWDGSQHWWQSYANWGDVINNRPFAQQTSTRHGDIYKGIAFDPLKRQFLSLAQQGSQVWLLKYAAFNDMVSVKPTPGGTFNFQSAESYAGIAVGPVNPTLDVYLVAGQSNAVGWNTDGAWLAAHPGDSQIRFFYRIGWGMDQQSSTSGDVTTLRPQVAAFRSQIAPTNFGIEMGAGRGLYDAGRRRMAMVKVAFGGTNLHSQWSPLNNSGLFKLLQDQLSQASNRWNSQGHRTRIVGLFWMQGEEDAKTDQASAYGRNLKSFVASVRSLAADSCLPVVLGRIYWNWRPNGSLVRAAQEQFAAGDECARWVSTDDLKLIYDDYHFDSPSEYLLGQRMAGAYREIAGW
jgi:hypothetical protein